MNADLCHDTVVLLDRLASEGRFSDRRHALRRAADLLREEAGVVADLREGFASVERGEGTPLAEVAEAVRLKYGIQRRA